MQRRRLLPDNKLGELAKVEFKPGINREITSYSNSGGWYSADKVRWRKGYPEKIGGWSAITQTPFEGVCRHIHQWSDLESDRYIGLGTSSHLYLLWGEQFYDLTPIRATHTGVSYSITGGVMTVLLANHGARVGDFVNITGASDASLNRQWRITGIANDGEFSIAMPEAAGGSGTANFAFLINSGAEDATVGQGWGIPPWGGTAVGMNAADQVGWGTAFDSANLFPADLTVVQMRIWDLDNFGEDLVGNIRGGPIYYWRHASGHQSPAVELSQLLDPVSGAPPVQPPTIANQILVSPNDRHLIAYGCNDLNQTLQDLLLVRWCAAENVFDWMPLRTNDAGGMRLGSGSFIICAMRTAQVILIWTDLGLWTQSYIGMPYVFGFLSVAEGLSIISPNACINIGSAVLWMDRGIFYAYTGQVQELPCALKDYVFSDLNYTQAYKIYAGHNHAFSEVTWYYPSAGSNENDSYVMYNYAEQLWSMGKMDRTAWLDMGRNSYPVATDRTNRLIYYHEFGDDANGAPMGAWIDSADIDINGGDSYLFMRRFMPDVLFRGAGESQEIGVTIFGRSAPLEPKRALARLQVTPHTGQQYVRVRERQISFRFESFGSGIGWRLGTIRADWQPDGRRR